MLNWGLAREVGYPKFFYRYALRQTSKRILKIDNTLKLKNGIVMDIPRNSRFGTEVFLKNGYVDWGSEEYLIKYVDEEKTFLDIGANIGYYSLLLAPYCRYVYAFEPDSRSLAALKQNVTKVDNIKVVREALYSEIGEMKFDTTTLPEFSKLRTTSTTGCINVKVNTLDNFANLNPDLKVTAIKTDVEGADFDVLMGGKNLIARDQPLILSELYPDRQVFKYVEKLAYSVFGFVKPRDRITYSKPQFVQITDNPQYMRPKMVFLVPSRLHQEFCNLTQPTVP